METPNFPRQLLPKPDHPFQQIPPDQEVTNSKSILIPTNVTFRTRPGRRRKFTLLSWLQYKCRSAPKEQRGWKTRASSPSSFPVPCPPLSLTKFLQAAESKRQTRGHKNCVEKAAEQSELNTSARGRGCCSPVSPWLLRKPLTDTTQRLGCAGCVTKSWQGNIFKREFHFTQSHNETGSFPNEICGQSVNWILPLTCKRYLNPHEAQCLTKPQLLAAPPQDLGTWMDI